MKISLSIGPNYEIRSYYENSDLNKHKYLVGNDLEHNWTVILLLNTIKKFFDSNKHNNDWYSDISEICIKINAWWNFELWTFPEILQSCSNIIIKKIWDQPVQEFIVNESNHNIYFEWWFFHKVSLQNIECESLKFSNIHIEKYITFKNVKVIENITFDSCFGTSAINEVTALEFDEESKIKQLNLIRTSFWFISIIDSEIKKIFPYKIHFNKVEYIGNKHGFNEIIKKNGTLENTLTEIKDYYRQLKYAHDEIGNKTEANKFFAKEMEYHRKSLEWKDWDKVIVSWLQQYTNNYGNSWIRPFMLIFVVSFLYTFLMNCWWFQCSCGWDITWSCFHQYWLKNIAQFPTELKNIPNWYFLLYSLIMGWLIYQFIIALRRISQR